MCDAEFFCVLLVRRGGLFDDAVHRGSARTFFQGGEEAQELLLGADGVNFDAAVAQIAHVSGEVQAFGGVLREVAIAYALHQTRNEISSGLFFRAHRVGHCSKYRTYGREYGAG